MESEVRAFRSFLLAVILVLAPPGSWPATVGTPAPMAQDQVPSLAPMLERVLPAVVSIAVRGREQEPREREFQAVGSGVIVDPERGHVITNNHVVEEDDEIPVALSDGGRKSVVWGKSVSVRVESGGRSMIKKKKKKK